MTSAPPNILAARTLLISTLDAHPTSTNYPSDLDPKEVGIVGDPAHRGGYHCGKDRVVYGDYSVIESGRDRAGLSNYASALDVGQFAWSGYDLRHFSKWLVGECAKGAADTKAIREVIYSPDGKVVRRWDRLGRRSSGDSTHLWHTHISFFRDARGDLTPVFRRYLIHIGRIPAPTPPAVKRKRISKMLVLQKRGDQTLWLSFGPTVGRVALIEMSEVPSDTPWITVKDDARLTAIGGKVLA